MLNRQFVKLIDYKKFIYDQKKKTKNNQKSKHKRLLLKS